MADGRVETTASEARLLMIDGAASLAERLQPALSAGLPHRPTVVQLTTGRLGLDLLRSSSFDVVTADLEALCDLGDGAEDRIGRLARAASGAIVLLLSDDASISVALSAMQAGAHDCVARNIEPEALVERMAELARRHGKARALFGDAANAVASGGTPIPSIPVMRDLVLPMWRQEQRIIEDAIQSFAGNIALAAAALELSPSTIYRKRQAWAELEGRRAEMAAAVSAR